MNSDTQLIDQQGMSYITNILTRKDCVINEYHRENGLDAICEIRESPYLSSGSLVAIQLKSGKSYFHYEDDDNYFFYADKKHIDYWIKCCIPVLFIMYNPELDKAFWININKNNLIMTKNMFKIVIPKTNDLNHLQKNDLLSLFYGKLYNDENSFQCVFNDLKSLIHTECCEITVSAFEIFLNGLCDMCRQLYFFVDIYNNIIEYKLSKTDVGGYGQPYASFYDDYFYILNYHNIISGTFEQELTDLNENNMIPFFMKHLSQNGIAFLQFLRNKGVKVHDRIYVRQVPDFSYIYIDS